TGLFSFRESFTHDVTGPFSIRENFTYDVLGSLRKQRNYAAGGSPASCARANSVVWGFATFSQEC
ncbi:MAG: hypothetical protein LBB62_00570, partial [Proteiniphilum sp.]|nr:hypothetical protein [Proteiniphilum sp.]